MDLANEIPFRIALAILLALFAGIAWYFQDGIKRSKRITIRTSAQPNPKEGSVYGEAIIETTRA